MNTLETPPAWARLKYRLLNVPPDQRYRAWVEADLRSPFWGLTSMIPVFIWYSVGGVVLAPLIVGKSNEGFLVGSLIGLSVVALLQTLIPPWRRWSQARMMRAYERRWRR